MRRISFLVAVMGSLLISAALSACTVSPFGVGGSGDVVSEARDVSGFGEIALKGSGTVNLEVTGSESLTIEADGNLMEYLETDVRDGRLELGATRSIRPTQDVVYTITAISLDGVSISGSGTINVVGVVGDRFDVEISGSGSFDAPDVQLGSVMVSIGGSGDVELVGTADHLELSVSGSGTYSGEDLIAATGDVTISGSGKAVVNVTDSLQVEISGSGNLDFFGDPTLDASTSGSGRIQAR